MSAREKCINLIHFIHKLIFVFILDCNVFFFPVQSRFFQNPLFSGIDMQDNGSEDSEDSEEFDYEISEDEISQDETVSAKRPRIEQDAIPDLDVLVGMFVDNSAKDQDEDTPIIDQDQLRSGISRAIKGSPVIPISNMDLAGLSHIDFGKILQGTNKDKAVGNANANANANEDNSESESVDSVNGILPLPLQTTSKQKRHEKRLIQKEK